MYTSLLGVMWEWVDGWHTCIQCIRGVTLGVHGARCMALCVPEVTRQAATAAGFRWHHRVVALHYRGPEAAFHIPHCCLTPPPHPPTHTHTHCPAHLPGQDQRLWPVQGSGSQQRLLQGFPGRKMARQMVGVSRSGFVSPTYNNTRNTRRYIGSRFPFVFVFPSAG